MELYSYTKYLRLYDDKVIINKQLAIISTVATRNNLLDLIYLRSIITIFVRSNVLLIKYLLNLPKSDPVHQDLRNPHYVW